MNAMSLLLECAIKVSLIVSAALLATALLRTRSAAVRHWVLFLAIGLAAVMPLLGLLAPSWHLRLDGAPSPPALAPVEGAPSAASAPADASVTTSGDRHRRIAGDPEGRRIAAVGPVLIGAWLAGTGLNLLILVAGLARLRWLASASDRLSTGTWSRLAAEMSRTYGLRRPLLLLQSRHPSLLVTWGILRPKVILPVGAGDWPDDRIRVVLAHELAHVRRGDWLAQMTAELLRALYWFNPLVWIACRRLRLESEQACDDEVLSRGSGAVEYAAHLLALARALGQRRRSWLPAPAMARPSSLERRIRAMLNTRLNHRPMTRTARLLTGIVVFCVAVPIAGLSQTSSATLIGSVHDPSGKPWAGVALALSHVPSGETFSSRTGESGAFEFVELRAGEYRLEARLPGFAVFEETITLAAGSTVHRNIALELGSVQETATALEGSATDAAPRDPARARELIDRFRDRPLQPPVKVHHVQAVYPDALRGTGVEGHVTLQGVIGTDGAVTVLGVVAPVHPETLSPLHPELARAAVDAVRQWRFEPTRLHGSAVETRLNVTVGFKAEEK